MTDCSVTRVRHDLATKPSLQHTEKMAMWRQGQRLELFSQRPKNTRNHQKLEESRKDSPPKASRRNMALL